MWKYILKRVLWMIPVLLGVSVFIFTLLYFVPGDPANIILGSQATAEAKMELREQMGLNEPYIVQLGSFLKSTFLEFDFGESYISRQSVSGELAIRLPYTLKVCWTGLLIALILGVPLGVLAATNQNTWKDNIAMLISIVAVSMPSFWFALMMIYYFAMKLGWLPVQGVDTWRGYIIPCICSALGTMAAFTRQTRSSMLEVIRQDYITTARAKGQTEKKIIFGHALRNSMLPIVTSLGGMMAGTIGFGVVIESIFSIPGLGNYLLTGINNRDYPVVRGCVLVFAFIFALMSLVVDLVYGVVDPRLKSTFASGKKKKKQKKTAGEEA